MVQDLIPTLHCLEHSATFRVLWALEELKANYGTVFHLKTYPRQRGQAPEELKKIFPLGKSPILTLEWSDKRAEPLPTFQVQPGVLTEAQLILRFLNDEYGKGVWNPESKEDERRDTFFQGFATMSLSPKLDMLVTLESLLMVLPFGVSGLVRLILGPLIYIFQGQLPTIFQFLETSLSEEKPWFSGARFGLADFNMSFGMDTASQRGYIDYVKFPKLTEWHKKIQAQDGYVQALKECGGYDLKTYGMKG